MPRLRRIRIATQTFPLLGILAHPPGCAGDPLQAYVPVDDAELRVLFIGNSVSYVNDVPGMVQTVAAASAEVPGSGVFFEQGRRTTLVDLATMRKEGQEMRSAEEAKLDFLVGTWASSDRTYPGPQRPGGTSEGTASYRWEVGGKWLVYDFQTDIPGLGPYAVRGGVAYEPREEKLVAYSVNSTGALLLYDGSWESEETLVFTLAHPRRDADTRVSYARRPDGTVRMTSERPAAGGGREIYFETVLSRQVQDGVLSKQKE